MIKGTVRKFCDDIKIKSFSFLDKLSKLYVVIGVCLYVLFASRLGYISADLAISIMTLTGVFYAVTKYYEEKELERKSSVIQQIAFYRENIIQSHSIYVHKASELGFKYSRIKLDNPSLDFISKNQPGELALQKAIFTDEDLHEKQTIVLNFLEEFSIRVLLYRTERDSSLDSVKTIFVQTIENSAFAILEHRDIISGMTTYSNLLKLYQLWKDEVDRRYAHERTR